MLSVRNHAQDSGKSPRSNIPTPPTPQMNLDAHHRPLPAHPQARARTSPQRPARHEPRRHHRQRRRTHPTPPATPRTGEPTRGPPDHRTATPTRDHRPRPAPEPTATERQPTPRTTTRQTPHRPPGPRPPPRTTDRHPATHQDPAATAATSPPRRPPGRPADRQPDRPGRTRGRDRQHGSSVAAVSGRDASYAARPELPRRVKPAELAGPAPRPDRAGWMAGGRTAGHSAEGARETAAKTPTQASPSRIPNAAGRPHTAKSALRPRYTFKRHRARWFSSCAPCADHQGEEHGTAAQAATTAIAGDPGTVTIRH